MSETNSEPATTKAAKAADKKPVVVRCRVLADSLACAGGTAAKGRVLNLYQDAAEYHEKRGEIRVLGTK